MQMPGEEQSFAVGIPMWQSAALETHITKVRKWCINSLVCRDESRHGGHEWPRHVGKFSGAVTRDCRGSTPRAASGLTYNSHDLVCYNQL